MGICTLAMVFNIYILYFHTFLKKENSILWLKLRYDKI